MMSSSLYKVTSRGVLNVHCPRFTEPIYITNHGKGRLGLWSASDNLFLSPLPEGDVIAPISVVPVQRNGQGRKLDTLPLNTSL